MKTPYDDLIRQVSNLYGLPFNLLQSQVLQESSGRADAFRFEQDFYERYIETNQKALGFKYGKLAACSYGLLQIMFETALELGFTDQPHMLFDPRVGLSWGAKKMKALWEWSGGLDADYGKALSAYNGGTARAQGPPFPNQAYVDAIYVRAGTIAA